MNYLDLIFGLLFLWAAYRGFSKGLLHQAATLVALIAGLWGAVRFSGFAAEYLRNNVEMDEKTIALVSFLLVFIVIVILIHLIAKLLEKFLQAIALGFVNRVSGLLFSLIKMAFFISVILIFVNTINKKLNILPKEQIDNSILYKPLSNFVPMVFPHLKLHFEYFKREEKQANDEDGQFFT